MASDRQQHETHPDSLLRELREKALVSFAEGTSAHGVMHLTRGSGLSRLIWVAVIIGACSGFAVHLRELAQRYLSYPVSTEFSSEGADFQFPTVTICPTYFITAYTPVISSNYSIPGHPRNMNDMIFDVALLFYQLKLDNWNVSMPPEDFDSYYDGKFGLRSLAYRGVLFQQPYETVIYCRYNSELCTFENFTVYKDEDRFMCLSFNPTNRTIAQAGEGNGLYLVLYNYGFSFLTNAELVDNVPGFRVAIHENGFKPDMASGFNALFGYKTSAQITVQTDTKVNREAAPCVDDMPNVTYTVNFSYPGNFEDQSFFGSTQDCVIKIMQEEYKSTCGCLGTHLPLPSDLMNGTEVCHQLPEEVFFFDIKHRKNMLGMTEYVITNQSWSFITLTEYLLKNWAVYNLTAQHVNCFHRVLQRQKTQGVSDRQCPVRCSNIRYSVTTGLSTWPRDASLAEAAVKDYAKDLIKRIAGTNLSSFRPQILYDYASYMINNKFISVLDLYPKFAKVSVFTESFAYQLRNLLSDLGGILGLWVGVSIITLLELVELIIQLLYLSTFRAQTGTGQQVHPLHEAKDCFLQKESQDIGSVTVTAAVENSSVAQQKLSSNPQPQSIVTLDAE